MVDSRNVKKAIFLIIAIALGTILGWSVLRTPAPLGRHFEISAYRMYDHLQVIAAEERSVFHPQRRLYVRDYIIQEIERHGLTAEIDYFTVDWEDYAGRNVVLEGSNVFVRIYGRNDTAIMLMAHYDSRGVDWTLNPASNVHSPGAADAGYGLSIMLEIARLFAGQDLENSIYLFFTDLEEIWMLGAEHAASTMDLSNVSMILNLEGRGVRGPVYMFETSPNDLNVVRFFNEATRHRMSYSLATAILRMMPNDTDLTPFLERDFIGMNFAPLNSIFYYHTPDDSLENISLSTMQQYIEMIHDIVALYVTDPRFSDVNYFRTNQDGVYFSLPLGFMVLYSDTTAKIMSFIMLAFVMFIMVYFWLQNEISINKIFKWWGCIFAFILLFAALGIGTSQFIARFTGQPFYISYVLLRPERYVMWVAVAITIIAFILMHGALKNRFTRNEMVSSSMLMLAVVNVVLSLVMPAATFLVFVPLVLTVISVILSFVARNNIVFISISASLPIILMGILFIPVLFSFLLALTIGGLGILLVLAIIMVLPFPALWRDVSSYDSVYPLK